MKVHLQPWYDRWLANAREAAGTPPNSNDGPSLHQVHFVRDTLCGMLWADVPYDKRGEAPPRTCKETCFVVGEHSSKSVALPVYSLERPDLGLQFVLRYNYHDWNVSVITEKPLSDGRKILAGFQLDYSDEDERKRFPNGYRPGNAWGYCYFQGFPQEVQFGPYSEDCRRFSLCIGSDYSLHTFLWLILRDIRGVGPWPR